MGGGSTPILRAYTIQEMNNTILSTWYKCLNSSWIAGIHEVNAGDWTPIYAPFSWDVMQPFKRPYILNNYPKLCVDINAYNGAKDKKNFDLDVKKSVNVTLQVPCTLDLEIPESGATGDPVSTALNFHLHPERANLTLDVFLNFSSQVDLFFSNYSWQAVFDKTYFLDFGNPLLQTIGELVKFTTDSSFTFTDVDLGPYVSITGAISPHLLGTIFDVEVKIHLADILETLLGPTYGEMVGIIVDTLDLVINPQIIGYLAMDVYAGGSMIQPRAQFTQVEQSIPVTFTLPDESPNNFSLEIRNITYGINFKTNWSLDLEWGTIPSLILNDYTWQLDVWPDIDIDLVESTTTLNSIAQYAFDTGKNMWVLESAFGKSFEPAGQGIGGYFATILLVISIGVVGIIIIHTRKRL